jgi:hypothetical protein
LNIKQINLHYRKVSGLPEKPAHLNLQWADINSISGLDGSWGLDKTSISDGLIKFTTPNGQDKAIGDQVNISLAGVVNPEIADCSTTGLMYDICTVFISTYSDYGNTLVDSGAVNYQIQDEPSLTFSVEGVSSGTVINNITTNASSEYDKLNFGHLEIRQPIFISHKLHVETTASIGYEVNMSLDGYIQGLKVVNNIQPFQPVNCSWESPKTWISPTGTSFNSDTAWIGANTTDTRISGWTEAANKFGPVSSTPHSVMFSSTKDYGTDAYVTYGIEVNEYQPPDSYAGTIIYEVLASY